MSVQFTPDGKRLMGCGTHVTVWEVDSAKVVCCVDGVRPYPESAALSPDGKRVCWGTVDGKVMLLSVPD